MVANVSKHWEDTVVYFLNLFSQSYKPYFIFTNVETVIFTCELPVFVFLSFSLWFEVGGSHLEKGDIMCLSEPISEPISNTGIKMRWQLVGCLLMLPALLIQPDQHTPTEFWWSRLAECETLNK